MINWHMFYKMISIIIVSIHYRMNFTIIGFIELNLTRVKY